MVAAMKGWQVSDVGGDPETIRNPGGRYYFRKATITRSKPVVWDPKDTRPKLPKGWAGHGGLYVLLRDHHAQKDRRRIVYVGKALSFAKRLKRQHHMFAHIVNKRGDSLVSLGRIRFERMRSHAGYYEEIEQIVAWTVWRHLENYSGMGTVPGFRGQSGRPFSPWVVQNEDYRFNGQMPLRIAYPMIGIER